MALTPKQKRFVEEYLIDMNATQAAIRAKYSTKTAYSAGQRALKNVEIQAALQEAMKKRSERTEITQDQVLHELAKIGMKDAADYTDAELKYGNKIKALELLGKHLGMFMDKQPDSQNSEVNIIDDV